VLRRAIRPFDIPILVVAAAVVSFYFYRRLRHLRNETQRAEEP